MLTEEVVNEKAGEKDACYKKVKVLCICIGCSGKKKKNPRRIDHGQETMKKKQSRSKSLDLLMKRKFLA